MDNFGDGHTRLDELDRPDMPLIWNGLEAMLFAQIVMSWTMVETVCGDLWEACVNYDPKSLADFYLKSKGSANEGKKVDLNLLNKNNFDVRKVMGTLLKGRFSFDSRDGLVSAFADVFGRDSEPVTALESAELHQLEAIRNLLVHQNGRVDQKFLGKVSEYPTLAGLKDGYPIDLTGDLTVGLTKAAIDSSTKLIKWGDREHGDPSL